MSSRLSGSISFYTVVEGKNVEGRSSWGWKGLHLQSHRELPGKWGEDAMCCFLCKRGKQLEFVQKNLTWCVNQGSISGREPVV
jgi:hypothetical protein